MMAMAHAGFVFLSMPKAGSTALQKHFSRHAQILFRQPPGMKHMSAATFENVMAPWLERYGHPALELRDRVPGPAPGRPGAVLVALPVPPGGVRGEVDRRHDVRAVRRAAGLRRGAARHRLELRHHHGRRGARGPHLPLRAPRRRGGLDGRAARDRRRRSSTPRTCRPPGTCDVDPGVRALLEAHYADDVRLYESAL